MPRNSLSSQASGLHSFSPAASSVPYRPHLHPEDPLPHLWHSHQWWKWTWTWSRSVSTVETLLWGLCVRLFVLFCFVYIRGRETDLSNPCVYLFFLASFFSFVPSVVTMSDIMCLCNSECSACTCCSGSLVQVAGSGGTDHGYPADGCLCWPDHREHQAHSLPLQHLTGQPHCSFLSIHTWICQLQTILPVFVNLKCTNQVMD